MSVRNAVLAVVLAVAAAGAASAEGPQYGALQPPKGQPQRPVGLPALAAHPAGVHITAQEVAGYLHARNLPRNLGTAGEIKVASVETISVAALRERLGVSATGFGDQEQVALARLSGTLVFAGPRGTAPANFESGYAVFDAASGNLLMFGALP